MDSRTDEINRFKQDIPLPLFAAEAFSYVVVRKKTSANSCFMRCDGTGSKIAIHRAFDGNWTYFSVTDSRDRGGSIIDFCQHRTHENIGLVRKRLRPYLGSSNPFSSGQLPQDIPRDLGRSDPDIALVRKTYETEVRVLLDGVHDYLNVDRRFPPATFVSGAFAGSVSVDRRGNALFLHRDTTGVTGWEARNKGFRAFSKHGYKALWFTSIKAENRTKLVFAESAFDAIAYGLIHPDPNTCYCSTAGQMSPTQIALVAAAMKKLPNSGEVIVAADADEGGRKFVDACSDAFAQTNRQDLSLRAHSPNDVKDWNDAWIVKETPHNDLRP
jgi:hypothetical protein